MFEKENKLDSLIRQRDKYDKLMFEVLEWQRHLKKKWEEVQYPLSDEQKQKNNFLFRYYETQYNNIDKLIQQEIRN
jgi:hypothetical protein